MSEIDEQAEGEATNPTDVDETPDESTEEEEVEESEDDGELAALKAKMEELEEKNRHLAARAKKAEKSKKKRTDLATPDEPTSESVDERILLSQGMSADQLKELKRVARFNETDLMSAKSDPMFVAIQEKMEAEAQQKAASLGASKGSGGVKARKTFDTPNLKTDDHKKMWKEAAKKL